MILMESLASRNPPQPFMASILHRGPTVQFPSQPKVVSCGAALIDLRVVITGLFHQL